MSFNMKWDKLLSSQRLKRKKPQEQDLTRTEFEKDFDRIAFSSAFRRLHDKTQVFPLPENDHVHSRLTHSLEASCVGRSLGNKVGAVVYKTRFRDLGDIVAAAC